MKILACLILLAPASLFTMSQTIEPTAIGLVNTKWISPVNDNCYEALCFTSARTVMYYRCETDTYFELGYALIKNKIEIEAYGENSMNPSSKLILYEDNGVIRQDSSQINSFPRNFIQVPSGSCD